MRIPMVSVYAALLATLGAGCAPSQDRVFAVDNSMARTRPEAVEIGRRVANWQLAARADLSYLRTHAAESGDARDWIQAAFFIGLERFARRTGDRALQGALHDIAVNNEWRLPSRIPWHGDSQAIASVYARVATAAERAVALKDAQAIFDQTLADPPRNDLKFIESKVKGIEGACQRRWCWSDALFMAPPSWIEVARVTGDRRYRDYAVAEYKATVAYLFNPEYGFFYRDSRFVDRRTNLGKPVFWSRGNGWVYAGIPLILEALPANDPDRKYFLDLYRKMSKAFVGAQKQDGFWPTSLADPLEVANPETSGSGFIVFGLAWGLRNGVLDDAASRRATEQGWKALTSVVSPEGKLGWVQQVGKSPDTTLATDTQFYGAGAFLLAASEMAYLR